MDNILIMFRGTKKQFDSDLKYNGIVNAFRNMGYHAWYTYNDNGAFFLDDGKKKIQIGKMNIRFEKITRNTALYKALRNFIKRKSIIFKYCYIRMMPVLPGYIGMIKAMKKSGADVALEIPTYPHIKENKTDTPIRKILLAYMEGRSRKAAKYTDLYLPMGEHTDSVYGKPAVNIENGVDVSLIKMREYSKPENDSVNMLAVAKITRWHGYDRVIEGMKLYYEKKPQKKVYFYIVGPDGDGALKRYRDLVKKYGLEEYVFFEGPKFGDDANEYFNKADVAFASLNIQGFKKVYPLKIVEYMARGVPFICTGAQSQIKSDWEFCMSVEMDGTPIDIDKVIDFAEHANQIENVSTVMRTIAIKENSWEKQMKKMIDFFEKNNRR